MASKSARTASSILLKTSRNAARNTIARALPPLRSQTGVQRRWLSYSGRPLKRRAWNGQRRWSSEKSGSGEGESKEYAYQDVVELIEKPSEERVLIDTREPHELLDTGRIPGAINIPVASQSDAYFITNEEFEDRFGFQRPGKEKECVFYCKAGVRSRSAAELARQGGWEKVAEYRGSWMDWVGKGGVVER